MAGTSNNEQQNSSFSLDPFVELKGMMQAIIERQDTVEQTVVNFIKQNTQMHPNVPESEVASPFPLEVGNNDREIPTKMEEEMTRMKEVLKGITQAEPWMDIHGLTLFPKARLPYGFKMPVLSHFDGTGSPTNFLKLYVGAMSPWGIDEPLMAQLFQQYLDGALISTGSLVEDAIKKGKIKKEHFNNGNSYSSRFGANKMITNNDASASKPTNMIYNIGATSAFQLRPQRQFTPLNMTYAQAFSKLKKANLIQPLIPRPPPRNPPPTYSPNKHCEFRQGAGHDIESCTAFKNRLQDLIDGGRFSVGTLANKPNSTQPSITNNPLPNHKPPTSINAISTYTNDFDPTQLITRNEFCECEALVTEIGRCLDNELASHRIIKIRGHNYTLRKDPFAMMCGAIDYDNAYFILDREEDEDAASVMAIVERNTGAYFSTPNNYSHPICLGDFSDDEVVEVSHLTRASRHFKPSYLEEDNPLDALRRKEKGKELMVDEVNIEDDAIKRMKEVNANVSIWKLLMHSQPHQSAVLKHLNEASVDPSITPDQIVGLIHGAVTIPGNPDIMNISPIGKSMLHLDEEEGSRLDGFNVFCIQSGGWIEVSDEDSNEELEDPIEIPEEGDEPLYQEKEEEPRTPEDRINNEQQEREGESWTSSDSHANSNDARDDFDLDFDVPMFRVPICPEKLILFPGYKHEPRYQDLPKLEKFDGTGDSMIHLCKFVNVLPPLDVPEENLPTLFDRSLEGAALSWYYSFERIGEATWNEISQAFVNWAYNFSQTDPQKLVLVTTLQTNQETFSHFCSRCSVVRSKLRNPITDKEFMLIMLKNLNDFYYRQMVTMRYNILGHMEQHGQGLIRIKGYVCAIPPPEVNMERYCSYCSQFGHTTNSCYDLRCSIQDLIDRRIIDPIHTRPRTGHNLVRRFSSQQWSSQSAIFRGLLDEGAIKPLPRRPGASPIGVDLHKYCHYHQLHGHDTDGCHALPLRIKHITKISHLSRKRLISINVLSTSNDEEDPTSLMTYDPLSEEMGRMNVNERLSPAPQSDGSSSDEEPFWMKDEEFAVTADGEDTPVTKVDSIQSTMEPHIFLRRIDNETKKACTQVCKAWARWLYKMKQDGYDEEPSEGSGH
uniref:Retrotransposon gag domain-containing protein n=1 Tax=Chenopodium quinoa TaxID=63459 RepID=A0A803N7Z3_CHEQI